MTSRGALPKVPRARVRFCRSIASAASRGPHCAKWSRRRQSVGVSPRYGLSAIEQQQEGGSMSSARNRSQRRMSRHQLPDDVPVRAKSSHSGTVNLVSVTGVVLVTCLVGCEIVKQVSNYSLQYFNRGQYPVPQTVMVLLVELIKLLATVVKSGGNIPSLSVASVKSSFKFLLPSVSYAINNNIYFVGLRLVAPPIWIILCSFRTVVTAVVYKFVFKKPLSRPQFVGTFLIVASIAVAKSPDLMHAFNTMGAGPSPTAGPETGATLPVAALLLALVAASNSAGTAVYTENLFKGSDHFLHQQFWLYSYGCLVALLMHWISHPDYPLHQLPATIQGLSPTLTSILALALLCGSLGGIIVASILKLLDNIVKEYSASLANTLTAVVCAFLFPDTFAFTPFVVLSMFLLFTGIYLYENYKLP